jgi:hypothetical protein
MFSTSFSMTCPSAESTNSRFNREDRFEKPMMTTVTPALFVARFLQGNEE